MIRCLTPKIGLGTVQFGQPYGISNSQGQTPIEEVKKILSFATKHAMSVLDTAAVYGESETILGQLLPNQHTFDIVTKVPALGVSSITERESEKVRESFFTSLRRLKQPSIYGLLMHDANDFLASNGQLLMGALLALKEEGLVKKIGVSVYTPEQVDRIVSRYPIDLIQLPLNVFDQRFLLNGQLRGLKKQGVEIHARSIFLQGLLLMESEYVPTALMALFKECIERYHAFRKGRGLTLLQSALNFVMGVKEVDHVIVGVNHLAQLQEICQHVPVSSVNDYRSYAVEDERLINPSLWKAW